MISPTPVLDKQTHRQCMERSVSKPERQYVFACIKENALFQLATSELSQFVQRFEVLFLYAGRGLDFYASDPATAVLQHDVNFMFSVVPKVVDIHLLLSPGRLLAQLHEYQVLQQASVILACQYLAGISLMRVLQVINASIT